MQNELAQLKGRRDRFIHAFKLLKEKGHEAVPHHLKGEINFEADQTSRGRESIYEQVERKKKGIASLKRRSPSVKTISWKNYSLPDWEIYREKILKDLISYLYKREAVYKAADFEELRKKNGSGSHETDDSKGDKEIFNCETGTKCKDIHITLISEDTVRIKTPSGEARFGYRDLGLKDTRDGKPRKLWMYLRIFAKAQGIIFAETFDEPELKQYRKYLPVYASKLNKHLQELFGIKESIYTSHYKNKKPLPGERARLQNGHLGKKIKRKVGYETNIMFSDATQFVGTKPKEQSKSEEIGEMFQGFGEYEKY